MYQAHEYTNYQTRVIRDLHKEVVLAEIYESISVRRFKLESYTSC